MTTGIHIDTSGWHYRHWRGSFYPLTLKSREMFAHYADRFSSVEINNSDFDLDARDVDVIDNRK